VSGDDEVSSTEVVELTLMVGSIGHNGPISCPECGERVMLVVVADPAETGEEPAVVRCPFGHAWPEPGLPRRTVAEVVAHVAELDPDVWREVLHIMRERGHVTVPGLTLRLVDAG
jgi:hypothetical protein